MDKEKDVVVCLCLVRVWTVNVQIEAVLRANHSLIGLIGDIWLKTRLGDVIGEEVATGKDFLYRVLRRREMEMI